MPETTQQNAQQNAQQNGSEDLEQTKRWTAKRRSALVLSILRGETSAAEAARAHDLTVAQVEEWKERFLSGAENALRSRPLEEEAQKEHEIKRLKQKVGELVMDLDILKEATKAHPLLRQMPNE
jgi:transposase-like protein